MQSESANYYDGYENDDEPSENEEKCESSSDEIEKDLDSFLKCKKTKKTREEKQANEFENEMDKQLEQLIDEKQEKYLKNSFVNQKKNDEPKIYEEEDTDSEEEFRTGVRCTKKRQKFTNDDLLYDENMDEDDENWINKQRKTSKKVLSPAKNSSNSTQTKSSISSNNPITNSIHYIGASSDAILNCPCCITNVCCDCQRHEKFKTQFRAMFVFNCKINFDEQLKYPKNELDKKKFKKSKLNKVIDSVADIKIDGDDDEQFDLFKPVECINCNTEIGVYDEKEELYHFFNVLASHS